MTGLVGAAAIVLMLLLVPGLLRNLPNPTLAAVVIAASLSLADIPATVRLWRQGRVEFLLSGAAFLGVALLGVCGHRRRGRTVDPERFPPGLVAAPHHVGARRRNSGQHDIELHPNAEQLRGSSSSGSTRRCSSPTRVRSATRSGGSPPQRPAPAGS